MALTNAPRASLFAMESGSSVGTIKSGRVIWGKSQIVNGLIDAIQFSQDGLPAIVPLDELTTQWLPVHVKCRSCPCRCWYHYRTVRDRDYVGTVGLPVGSQGSKGT